MTGLSDTAAARLDALAALTDGWDSYGAPPIAPEAISAARAALDGLFISPTCNGGVAIEIAGTEIEFGTDGQIVADEPDLPADPEPAGGLQSRVPTRRESITTIPLNTPALLLSPEQLAERDAAFERMRRRQNATWAKAADVVVD